MRKELDEKLCRDFPALYAQRNMDMQSTCICWGFECGDGWEPLIRRLSEKLTKLASWEGADVQAVQVKEKFGTLRFYVQGGTPIMQDCIEAAENESSCVCEVCGERGSVRGRHWVACRCKECAVDQGYPIEEWEAKSLRKPHEKEPIIRVKEEDI